MHILLTIVLVLRGLRVLSVLPLFASPSASACLLFSTFKWYTDYLLGCLNLVHSGLDGLDSLEDLLDLANLLPRRVRCKACSKNKVKNPPSPISEYTRASCCQCLPFVGKSAKQLFVQESHGAKKSAKATIEALNC